MGPGRPTAWRNGFAGMAFYRRRPSGGFERCNKMPLKWAAIVVTALSLALWWGILSVAHTIGISGIIFLLVGAILSG